MDDNPQRPARRSPRLKGYDYAQEGAYFVTICTQHRAHLFGEVLEGEMRLNAAGEMVAYWWGELSQKYPNVEVDAYRVMPNHLHGIILIVGEGRGASQTGLPSVARPGVPLQESSGGGAIRPGASLLTIIQWFKTMTTNAYLRGVREQGWESFHGKLWQRSFHDHIIRTEHSLNTLREYSENNPMRWEEDEFNRM
jgi:REP element-mobilizing transposase RayT